MDAMVVLKATLLLTLTLIAARCLGRAPAATRHRLWSLAFASVLALPFLASALPDLQIVAPASWTRMGSFFTPRAPAGDASNIGGSLTSSPPAVETEPGSATTPGSGAAAPVRHRSARAATTAAGFDWLTVPTALLAAWLLGAIAASLALILSLLRVRRLARSAEDIDDVEWRKAADSVAIRLGLQRPVRLLTNPAVTTPMAGGIWTPVVFLPAAARDWSTDRRDIVLAHEIAHLAGRDPLRHLVARLAVAAYWFHPLAWIAARHAAVSREQACDEAVLALGTRPSTYARVLLDLAESMHSPAPALGALPMVERSLLEKRLMAILSNDGRLATSRTVLIPALAVALLTLVVAAAEPTRSQSAPAAAPAVNGDVVGAPHAETPNGTAASLFASQSPRVKSQADVPRDSACWWEFSGNTSFSGSMSTSDSGGGYVIHEQVGTRGADRVIQKSFGDLRLCMQAVDVGPSDEDERPSHWLGRASRVVMEARRPGSGANVQRLEIGRQTAAGPQVSWRVGTEERPYDDNAERWRERMLAVFDTTWELSSLRGHVSSLHGEISSVRGEESSLRGEISSLQGEISSMRGHASSIRGEESSLRGEISSIEGHLSSLRGQRLEREIRDYDAAGKIAAVEQEIAKLNADGKVAEIEQQIRAFDLEGKIGAVEREISALDVNGKIAAIEREIKALVADSRSRTLEERGAAEIKQLNAAIGAIR